MDDLDSSPLVRTDFSDDAAWDSLVQAASGVSPDGFQAILRVVNDPAHDGAQPEQLAGEDWHDAAVFFVGDSEAQSNAEQPILCVAPDNLANTFRCVPSELWGVENNLRLANMDFRDFVENADEDGVFRGFR